MTDPYATLECEPGASHAELKKAYRRLARDWHPDRNDAPEAEARFRAIASAWEILGDPDKRRRYDLQIGAVARGELPEPFVLDVADAIERAEAWIRRGVLPTYAQHWRGRGAEMAARLWADLDELIVPSAVDLTRRQEKLGAQLAEPVIVTAWTRPAAGPTVLIRGQGFWEIGVVPLALWEAGFRDSTALDDAVMRLLLARYAQVVATGRLPWPEITVEEARALDDAEERRSWANRTLWGGTALLIAGMLCAGYFQL